MEALGKESETASDVNGRGPKQLGGGRPGGPDGCVTESHMLGAFSSVCYCVLYNCGLI